MTVVEDPMIARPNPDMAIKRQRPKARFLVL
jgi:hypothetical protein